MKALCFVLFCLIIPCFSVNAQFASQRDAMYLATIKAVADYKINDEENIKDIEILRQSQKFHDELTKMLSKLSNNRTKNSTNNRGYKILIKAGKDIYNELN